MYAARLCHISLKIIRNLRGIRMNDTAVAETEQIISQFADDAALFLECSEECLQEVVNTVTYVEKLIGLKLSYDKSCIYRVGSLNTLKLCCTHKKSSNGRMGI